MTKISAPARTLRALMLAAASLAIMPVAAQNAPVEPPMPQLPPDEPMPEEPSEPMAPPETPMPPPAPMPPADPTPEIPQPTPAPPTAPVPVQGAGIGPRATPPSAGAYTAVSGATTPENMVPVPSTKAYPLCTRVLKDNCRNPGENGNKVR